MKVNPYLNFNGNCREAFDYYSRVFGVEPDAMATFGESPSCDGIPADFKDKIMHTSLSLDGTLLMGSDCPPNYFEKAQGTSVALLVDDIAEAERVYHALAENGQVMMPMEETFWAKRFGMVTDQFGIPWMINCLKECQ